MPLSRTRSPSSLLDVRREAPVDLDDVDRELPQVRERRVARPEVVEREDDAEILDLLQRPGDALVGGEQRALGQLEREQVRHQGRGVERAADVAEEVGMVELARRDVDRHVHRAAVQAVEVGRLRARLGEHPFAEPDDEARLLGERDELAGRELAGGRVLPADERLVARDLVAVEVDDGLVVEPELLARDALAQLADPLRPLDGDTVELRVEERVAHLGVALRPVHGDVGLFEQRLVVAAEGDSDARGRIERPGAAFERPGRSRASSRSATETASSGVTGSVRTTANSSPPRRAAVSPGRTERSMRLPISCSTSSPRSWPQRSLIPLKSSRSM